MKNVKTSLQTFLCLNIKEDKLKQFKICFCIKTYHHLGMTCSCTVTIFTHEPFWTNIFNYEQIKSITASKHLNFFNLKFMVKFSFSPISYKFEQNFSANVPEMTYLMIFYIRNYHLIL